MLQQGWTSCPQGALSAAVGTDPSELLWPPGSADFAARAAHQLKMKI